MEPEIEEAAEVEEDPETAEEVVVSNLFVYKPLSEKLASGLDNMLENIALQREFAMDAAQVDEEGNRPPEVRLGRIESNGRVKLEFTNAMVFPSEREVNLLNEKSGNEMIDVYMFKGDEDVIDDNLKSWKIISVTPKLIEIEVVFENPIQVS